MGRTSRGVREATRRRVRYQADLLRELVARDIKLRYRRSVLGIAWSQIAPLGTMLVLSFVFSHVVPLGIKHYPEFVFVALLPWTWFQTAMVEATNSVVAGRDLIRQPGFAATLLPVAAIVSNLVNYVLALPVLLLFIGVGIGRIPVTTVLLPLVLAVQFLITIGPSLVLASLHVTFRDIAHIVGVLMVPLFYITPVLYPPSKVPARFHLIYDLNPLSHLMNAYRDVLLYGRAPDAKALLAIAAVGLALFFAGRAIFEMRSRRFAEEL
jgi:homopolymeric O-antigen transport system permease protein